MRLKPEEVEKRAKMGELTFCVVGLGGMGLPTACLFANSGVRVIGVDTNLRVVRMVSRGKCPILEPGLDKMLRMCVKKGLLKASTDVKMAIENSDVVIIVVPTLVDRSNKPDYSTLENACKSVGEGLKRGALVIIESTVGPGVTETLVRETLERASGLIAGSDFGLAYSPIRASSGRALTDLTTYPRVVGGINGRSLKMASAVLSIIVRGNILKVRNIRTAEVIKLFENVYRDVNIALSNQLAMFCEAFEVDYNETRKMANTQPFCHLHVPSVGVGGHCIPVNPYFLMEAAQSVGVDLSLLQLARKVNDFMPLHTVRLVREALKACGKTLRKAKVAVLGFSFKPNVKDARFTKVKEVVKLLVKRGAEVFVHDPYFSAREIKRMGYKGGSLKMAVKGADCILIAIGHDRFKRMDLLGIKPLVRWPSAIVDCAFVVKPSRAKRLGFVYRGLGRPK